MKSNSIITFILIVCIYSQLFAQLNGTYTIGGINPDYPTIDSAVTDLKLQGNSGDVVFNIRPGDYSAEFLKLNNILNINAADITFQSETFNPSDVLLTVTEIYQSSFIILNYVTIYPLTDGSYMYSYKGLDIQGSKNITICNSIIRGKQQPLYKNGISVVKGNKHKFINNTFKDLDNGITFSEYTYYGSNIHYGLNIIQGCTFDSCKTSIRINQNIKDSLIISHNTITNTSLGIMLDKPGGNANSRILVHHNIIRNLNNGYGIRLINCSIVIRIYNNMISDGYHTGHVFITPNGTFSSSAIYSMSISQSSLFEICNNSLYGGITLFNINTFKLLNNCIKSDTSILLSMISSSLYSVYLDYNNYHRGDGGLCFYTNAGTFFTLDDFKNNSSWETNGKYYDPNYVSFNDLHASGPSLCKTGVFIPYITDDIDGDLRGINPNIGADEFQCTFASIKHIHEKSEFTVYPNPSSNLFYISSIGKSNKLHIVLKNQLQQNVYEDVVVNDGTVTLDIDMPAGLYFLHLRNDEKGNAEILKIVKQ